VLVIPATQGSRRIVSLRPDQAKLVGPCLKTFKKKRGGWAGQIREYLPNKLEALDSIPSTTINQLKIQGFDNPSLRNVYFIICLNKEGSRKRNQTFN
jgi:hypothetical protein